MHAPSYYAATANHASKRQPLLGDVTADVCVIGAGFTGLSAALHMAEFGHKVIVLEAKKIGWGASGRNGGQIVNGYSRDYDVIKKRYGEDTARALLGMSLEGGQIIRDRVEKYNIQCDLKPTNFFAAFTTKQLKELEHKKKIWEDIGGHSGLVLYDKNDMGSVVDTDLYIGGLMDENGGHMHPLNLALGQAEAIELYNNSRIFEESPVTELDTDSDNPVVHTAQGKVTAKFVVVCGNAYLGKVVPQLRGKTMPVSSQVITTEVLGDKLTRHMMPSDSCVEDCNYMLDYYRITGDKRLLFGGGTVYGGKDPADIIARLHPHMLRTFPHLKDKKIDFAWSGNFALTLTRMPHVGRITPKIYFAHGYSGHGVTCTHLMGRLLAEAINNQSARFDIFAGMKNYPFPGGETFRVPLTILGAWYYRVKEALGI